MNKKLLAWLVSASALIATVLGFWAIPSLKDVETPIKLMMSLFPTIAVWAAWEMSDSE